MGRGTFRSVTGAGRCPTCKRAVPLETASAPYRPFCSQRCKMADLGSWLDGAFRISRSIGEEELDQGVAPSEDESGEPQ
ncbi:MAG TPA: DNA gyrase inhibitor YacG [Polyangia bacterium]|nr:DNA gyrase inhibitor YacG [Polyangia bacterium]